MIKFINKEKDDLLFSTRVSVLRKINNWSQKEASELMNVSDKVLSKWETGVSKPSLDELNKLAEIYKVSLDYLIKGLPNDKDIEIKDKVINLSNEANLENDLVELLKPYGRFTVEEKNKMFQISAKEILVNVNEVIFRGDIDLLHKLSEKYEFYRPLKRNPFASAIDYNPLMYKLGKKYKLDFNDVIYTNKIKFYKEALLNLDEKIKKEEERKKYEFSRGFPVGYLEWTNKENLLSLTLNKVLSIYTDGSANKIALFLIDNGAFIQVKVPYKYTEGYELQRDVVQTNMLKKMLSKK